MSASVQPLRQAGAGPSLLPRAAAAILLAMAAVLWIDILFRARIVDAIGASGYSTTAGVVIGAVVLPVAAGLWLRRAWAWWAGLVATAWQLLSLLLYIVVNAASGAAIGAVAWLIAVLLAAFLAVLLLPATRDACLRRQPEGPR